MRLSALRILWHRHFPNWLRNPVTKRNSTVLSNPCTTKCSHRIFKTSVLTSTCHKRLVLRLSRRRQGAHGPQDARPWGLTDQESAAVRMRLQRLLKTFENHPKRPWNEPPDALAETPIGRQAKGIRNPLESPPPPAPAQLSVPEATATLPVNLPPPSPAKSLAYGSAGVAGIVSASEGDSIQPPDDGRP